MAEASFLMGVGGWGRHYCGASCPAALVLGPRFDLHHNGTMAQAKHCPVEFTAFVCKLYAFQRAPGISKAP